MNNKEIRSLLKKSGLSITNPRTQILKILADINQPVSIEDIAEISKNSIAVSTIYRVIADLLDSKIVKTFNSPDQKVLVELSTTNTSHHHHLYCESCEQAFDIDLDSDMEIMIEKFIDSLKRTHNINVSDHSFEIYGTCNNKGHHKNRY
jgi:Fur family ferric uptake transcriptional regulator